MKWKSEERKQNEIVLSWEGKGRKVLCDATSSVDLSLRNPSVNGTERGGVQQVYSCLCDQRFISYYWCYLCN
ncbi:hypothetical protein E2C01_027084 [Portunus trituberculatus]|uniref:Uncharacterized protein n=1 Tax=Portunus trituberculatus TaxID=210409 RepID=A0A5B7EJY0_PORTR|nr:hypothetical protein [Portunus trituberculatus]